YGDIQALFNLHLQVEEGEIVTLLGSNGAGKTTTINAISGILHPRQGTIQFDGQVIHRMAPFRIVEFGLIQIPEGRMLFPDMTIFENLQMGSYSNRARENQQETLDWVFQLFPPLKERIAQLAGTLSGGEQQMLAIARGLMSKPKLLMLDEPSLGLAPLLVAELFRIVVEINQHGVAILLVEQNAIQALETAHRGYVLENGRIVLSGNASDLIQNDHVRVSYLGI
ncbi:MAG: branched-chain amino acid ABC transporter ATP-binding protein, partial [Deltaproteobacteria bacterium RBG_16_49_23]